MVSPLTARKLTWAAGIATASLISDVLLLQLSFFQTNEWKIYDLEFRRLRNSPELANPNIVMVTIDDTSVERIAVNGFGRFPWKRDTYGVLLDYFERARPKVVT